MEKPEERKSLEDSYIWITNCHWYPEKWDTKRNQNGKNNNDTCLSATQSPYLKQCVITTHYARSQNKGHYEKKLFHYFHFLTFFFSNGEQKLLGILIAVGEAVACVLLGMYGNVSQLGAGNAILIIIQLCFAGIIVICLKTVEPQ